MRGGEGGATAGAGGEWGHWWRRWVIWLSVDWRGQVFPDVYGPPSAQVHASFTQKLHTCLVPTPLLPLSPPDPFLSTFPSRLHTERWDGPLQGASQAPEPPVTCSSAPLPSLSVTTSQLTAVAAVTTTPSPVLATAGLFSNLFCIVSLHHE